MRDINRIPKICKELEELWLKCPDLRLGQLILNAFSLHNGVDKRVYYMEDYEFIEELKKNLLRGSIHIITEEEILVRVKEVEMRTNKSIEELCNMDLDDLDNFYDRVTIHAYKTYKKDKNENQEIL